MIFQVLEPIKKNKEINVLIPFCKQFDHIFKNNINMVHSGGNGLKIPLFPYLSVWKKDNIPWTLSGFKRYCTFFFQFPHNIS